MDAAELSRSLLEEICTEVDLASCARDYIAKGRRLLMERHREGASGSEIVGAYTTLIDHLVCHLFEQASRDYIRRYPSLDARCALIALGGYGRGELNPYSDIDLLFLYAWKITPYVESVAEKILYTLWDAGLGVGHAARNIGECVRLANKEMKVKTSLMDARHLCGDAGLYADYEKAVREQLVQKGGGRYVRDKLEENRLRHEHYGGSVYLLEPDIKEGEGGLRDIHAALWIAKVRRGIRDFDDLVELGIIQPKDLSELKAARDFLWRIRNELHFSSGRNQDQLTFDRQEGVARALGFKDKKGIKGVEAFMRNYYLQAAQISRLCALIIHRITDSDDASRGRGRSVGREMREGVRLSKGVLWISDPAILTAHPENLIGLFADAQRHGAEISHASRELIREHLGLIDERFRRSRAVNEIFFQILKGQERVYETLAEMHRCGVLGAFIPEFGRLLCLAQHDLYHIYTVDQHSLRLVKGLEDLKTGEFRESLPLLTQLVREVEKIEILYLGVLFHDIGKGFGGGHSEIGRRMVMKIARRMRLNSDDTAQLEFLVRQHLVMSQTAFRRDIDDEKLVFDFAGLMGGVTNLKMLYLLTYADMKAVGPDVWNNWKGYLLESLYIQASRVLEELEKGEFRREDRRLKVRRIQARLKRRLSPQYPLKAVRRFFRLMPDRYFLSTPEEEMPLHMELMEQLGDRLYLSRVRHFPEREYSEIVICAKDRPGLFASITGVFAAFGMDILNARIDTREDGLILDVFRISHGGRSEVAMGEGKWERIRTALEQVLSGAVDVARLVEESRPPALFEKRAPKVPTVIEIDNEASEDFTIVEVYTQDRVGVLFRITYALHQLGLSIHLAKISTNVDQVADVFYVTDEKGSKIKDPRRLEKIRETLYQRLVSDDERIAQPAH